MPLPVKLDKTPSPTVTTLSVKSVDSSLKIKLIVAVSPAIKEVSLVLIDIVGRVRSITIPVLRLTTGSTVPCPSV